MQGVGREGGAGARQGTRRPTVATVRNISLLLRPSLLDDLGLGPALQWHTDDFTRRTRVPCKYMEEGLQETLPDAVNTCVYRVVQEALRNCEKHSHAKSVAVHVKQTDAGLIVEVRDDGVGFSKQRRSPASLGVLGMRERAASLNGELSIVSSAGQGTSVRLQLPLNTGSAPFHTRKGARMNQIRILLADDHNLFRQGLRRILEGQEGFEIVAEASTGLEAIDLAKQHQPDVAVVDIAMKEIERHRGYGPVAAAFSGNRRPDPQHVQRRTICDSRCQSRSSRLSSEGHARRRPDRSDSGDPRRESVLQSFGGASPQGSARPRSG